MTGKWLLCAIRSSFGPLLLKLPVKMMLSEECGAVIKASDFEKGWDEARIVKEFPAKEWNKCTANTLIHKLRETGS